MPSFLALCCIGHVPMPLSCYQHHHHSQHHTIISASAVRMFLFNPRYLTDKTFHIVQGLSRTPLLFIPRYLANIFPEHTLHQTKISKIETMEI